MRANHSATIASNSPAVLDRVAATPGDTAGSAAVDPATFTPFSAAVCSVSRMCRRWAKVSAQSSHGCMVA